MTHFYFFCLENQRFLCAFIVENIHGILIYDNTIFCLGFYLAFYHPFFVMFMVSYWKAITSSPGYVPSQVSSFLNSIWF